MNRISVFISTFLLAFVVALPLRSEERWLAAQTGYDFSFPRDHGAHPAQKIEWWYYTGHLDTTDGRQFGYQLTFFRIGVSPKPMLDSPWAVRDLWMTHLAISDLKNGIHHHDDRLNRAGPGFAGAAADYLKVWNEDWMATQSPDGKGLMALTAKNPKFGLDLKLQTGKPPVIHGENGLSQKGAQAGNASHYYSLTRMPTQGILTLGDERFTVTGESWMDHEFGSSFLEPAQSGWDWVSVQLNDGSEMMLFQIRRSDGSTDTHTSGTLMEVDGTTVALCSNDFKLLQGEQKWTSPTTQGTYPINWQIEIPARQIRLAVSAVFPAQEIVTRSTPGLHYWEGVISVKGERAGNTIKGRGYLEMTGYSGPAMSQWFAPPTSK